MDEYVRDMTPLKRMRLLQASYRLTFHDGRLLNNDPFVYNLAHHLVRAMDEYSINQVTAAFRGALAIYADMCRHRVYEEI